MFGNVAKKSSTASTSSTSKQYGLKLVGNLTYNTNADSESNVVTFCEIEPNLDFLYQVF